MDIKAAAREMDAFVENWLSQTGTPTEYSLSQLPFTPAQRRLVEMLCAKAARTDLAELIRELSDGEIIVVQGELPLEPYKRGTGR